ncbi:MAG TPA: hypothetical protein VNW94_21030 [Streptosporangiaceae bacterium]|nr:hypothetical protein [Streptosporangiaceae bacterium]
MTGKYQPPPPPTPPTPPDPNIKPNGSSKVFDLHPTHRVPHNQLDRGWPPIKAHGQLNVDRTKLEAIAKAIDDELTAMKPHLQAVIDNAGMTEADFGPPGAAHNHLKTIVQTRQTAFTKYLTDLQTSFAQVSAGLHAAAGHYQTAETNSTPVMNQ